MFTEQGLQLIIVHYTCKEKNASAIHTHTYIVWLLWFFDCFLIWFFLPRFDLFLNGWLFWFDGFYPASVYCLFLRGCWGLAQRLLSLSASSGYSTLVLEEARVFCLEPIRCYKAFSWGFWEKDSPFSPSFLVFSGENLIENGANSEEVRQRG